MTSSGHHPCPTDVLVDFFPIPSLPRTLRFSNQPPFVSVQPSSGQSCTQAAFKRPISGFARSISHPKRQSNVDSSSPDQIRPPSGNRAVKFGFARSLSPPKRQSKAFSASRGQFRRPRSNRTSICLRPIEFGPQAAIERSISASRGRFRLPRDNRKPFSASRGQFRRPRSNRTVPFGFARSISPPKKESDGHLSHGTNLPVNFAPCDGERSTLPHRYTQYLSLGCSIPLAPNGPFPLRFSRQ